jgi:hypothetical protein
LLDVVNSQKLDAGNPEHLMIAFTQALSQNVLRFEKGFEPAVMRQKNAPMQGTLLATVQAQKDLDARAVASKKQEEKDAEAKRESAAQAATLEAIQAFALTKGGSMRYAPTNDFKGLLNQNVQRFRKDGMKWQLIYPQIAEWIRAKYQEFESQQSQSSTGGW